MFLCQIVTVAEFLGVSSEIQEISQDLLTLSHFLSQSHQKLVAFLQNIFLRITGIENVPNGIFSPNLLFR